MSAVEKHQPGVIIPRSPLASDIEGTAKIKEAMTSLLGELEAVVARRDTGTLGAWRRDPKGWKQKHLPGR